MRREEAVKKIDEELLEQYFISKYKKAVTYVEYKNKFT